MKTKPKRKTKGEHVLKNLSMHPLTMEDALKAFMQVDPKKVDERLEKDGITSGRKEYQRQAKKKKK